VPGNIPEKWRTIARRIVPAAGAVVDGHRIHRDRRGVCGDFQGGADRGLLIILGRPIADNKGIFRAGGLAGKLRAGLPCRAADHAILRFCAVGIGVYRFQRHTVVSFAFQLRGGGGDLGYAVYFEFHIGRGFGPAVIGHGDGGGMLPRAQSVVAVTFSVTQ